MLKHYRVRWTIEVFFKEEKGLLNLGGCQSSDFDAQIADTTISMIACILLSFRFRFEHYESKGELFRTINDECLTLTLDIRLWKLFVQVIQVIAQIMNLDADDLLKRAMTIPEVEHLLNLYIDDRLKKAG
jgi:hypothetical protein